MIKDLKLLLENINLNKKKKKVLKKVTVFLSCIVALTTVYFLMSPAITETTNKTYTIHLIDSYNTSIDEGYSWKTETIGEYTTNYDLKLTFMDTKGNYIEGTDLTIDIGPNTLIDDPYGFGYIPTSGESTRGLDLIDKFELNELTPLTGEKYIFDHAEVYVNGTWQTFTSDTGQHWNIWCQSASSKTKPDSYGWRGKYESNGSSIAYTITNTTEYKFVYKLVRLGIDRTVPSLSQDSGISFKIFNYTGDNTESGINANGLYDYFSFRDSALTDTPYINKTTDADGFVTNRAKVKPMLDSNGYPVFDCQGYCNNDTTIKNTSLGYLFGTSKNALGTDSIGVTSYNASNTILQKETIDNVEYYYYDSNRNAVDYDIDNNRFLVRDYVERGYIISTYEKETNRYEFLPFNYQVEDNPNKNYDYESAEDKTEIDHWYGMTMEFVFYMPANGKINNQDMIFSFSGDDDVWVFIDDVLVLDLGGTHGAVDGKINFSTGFVESYLNWNGVTGTLDAGTRNETSIYQMFQNANATNLTTWNEDSTTFKNYTKHTLKFFYLERGAAVANCKIRFNIPVLPSGSVSIQKDFLGTELSNEDYEFVLYDVTANSPVPAYTKYTIGEQEYSIDNNEGKFTLKNTEVATFKLTNEHTYYVKETNTGQYAVSHSCNLDEVKCPNINQTQDFTIDPESKYQATFTNKVKTYNLKLTKIAIDSDEEELFKFKITLKDQNNIPVDINNINLNIPHDYSIANTNEITFNLKHNETSILNNIPINTNITIEEINHNGYNTTIKKVDELGNEITLTNSDKYIIDALDSHKELRVYNTPGVVLPETGGNGSYIYIIIGFSLILFSIKYGYNYFFKSKEGDESKL